MNSSRTVRSGATLTRWILGATVAHLVVGIITHTAWLCTGNISWLHYYFDYEGALLLLTFSALEVFLTVAVYRQFSSDQLLNSAWLFIMLAACCHFLGAILKHLLSVDSYLNPIHYLSGTWNPQVAKIMAMGGP